MYKLLKITIWGTKALREAWLMDKKPEKKKDQGKKISRKIQRRSSFIECLGVMYVVNK